MKFKNELGYSVDQVITTRINPVSEFTLLMEEIKKRYPSMKVIYAYYDKDIDALHQYVLVIKQNKKDGITLFAMCPVIRFGVACLENFHNARNDNKLDIFFKELLSQPIVLEKSKFNLFITDECKLSLDKSTAEYWKLENNAHTFIEKIENLGKINFEILREGK